MAVGQTLWVPQRKRVCEREKWTEPAVIFGPMAILCSKDFETLLRCKRRSLLVNPAVALLGSIAWDQISFHPPCSTTGNANIVGMGKHGIDRKCETSYMNHNGPQGNGPFLSVVRWLSLWPISFETCSGWLEKALVGGSGGFCNFSSDVTSSYHVGCDCCGCSPRNFILQHFTTVVFVELSTCEVPPVTVGKEFFLESTTRGKADRQAKTSRNFTMQTNL